MLGTHKNILVLFFVLLLTVSIQSEENPYIFIDTNAQKMVEVLTADADLFETNSCLLYTSPSPRDSCASRMPSSA